jgi:hypothetical protein
VALSYCIEGRPLIPGAVEYMENLSRSVRSAIVDEVFSRRKAFHSRCDVVRTSPRIGIFAEQPETVHYAVYETVSGLWTCARRPITINSFQVPFGLLCDPIAHRCLGCAGVLAVTSGLRPPGQDPGATPWGLAGQGLSVLWPSLHPPGSSVPRVLRTPYIRPRRSPRCSLGHAA